MFKIKSLTLLVIMMGVFFSFSVFAKGGTVVQSYKDAMRNDMYEPGFHKKDNNNSQPAQLPPAPPVIAVTDPNEELTDINEEMARGLFTDDTATPVNIELIEKSSDVNAKAGQVLEVSISEEGDAKWSFSNDFTNLSLTNDYNFNGKKIMTFDTISAGEEKIYFDSIITDGENVEVLESRVLNIIVN